MWFHTFVKFVFFRYISNFNLNFCFTVFFINWYIELIFVTVVSIFQNIEIIWNLICQRLVGAQLKKIITQLFLHFKPCFISVASKQLILCTVYIFNFTKIRIIRNWFYSNSYFTLVALKSLKLVLWCITNFF